ncbi:MAG TPA: S8 family serine peptidase [Phycisphaerae bacterium]|nr:S8 family serine peptidase [Phycisphaerae bacterium]
MRSVRTVRARAGAVLTWLVTVAVVYSAAGVLAAEPPLRYPDGPAVLLSKDVQTFGTMAESKEQLLARYPDAAGKLRGQLLELADRRVRGGRDQAAAYATRHLLPVSDDCVTVIVVPIGGTTPDTLAPLLAQNGVNVIRIGKDTIKARLPVGSLLTAARNIGQIDYMRLPIRPEFDVVSEGVQKMNADDWHTCCTGAGTKVAVIDFGFIGLAAAIAAGEIPAAVITLDLTGKGMETDTVHGVGVAEIVYDLAPDAELHLIKIGDAHDLDAAKTACKTNGIDIISHSLGWYGFNFFDGVAYSSVTPSPVGIANDANADPNGILWVNSAGNDRRRNYRSVFTPYPGWPETHQFPNGGNINILNDGYQIPAGSTISAYLTWNNWPSTTEDYDLWLLIHPGDTWYILDKCETRHSSPLPPKELRRWDLDPTVVPAWAGYGLLIYKYSASGSQTLVLRSPIWDLHVSAGNYTPSGSIGSPGDAASVVAAGAIDEDVYTTGPTQPYSSLGPNNGAYTGNPALIKPDVCGPDDTASWTYAGGFTGTSAAAPHMAGVAALVLQRFPSYTNTQLRAYLESETIDLGDPGKDNEYGYGPVVLPDVTGPEIIEQPQPQTVCAGGNATFTVTARGLGTLHYPWYKNGSPVGEDSDTLTLTDVQLVDNGAQITCDVTDDCGTTPSDPATLTVNANPTATASNDGPVCEGQDVQLCGPDGMASYYWTGPDDYWSDQQCPVISPAVAGEYCLTVTDGNGCVSAPVCTTVEVTPLVTLLASEPPADGSLPKTLNNLILCTFDRPITLPDSGNPLVITDMTNGCADVSANFVYSIDVDDPNGTTLEGRENTDPNDPNSGVLPDLTWYQVESAPDWACMVPFQFEVYTLVGDCNNSGRVTTADYTCVKAALGARGDVRADLNGSGRVTTADYSVVKANIGHRGPTKPPLCP